VRYCSKCGFPLGTRPGLLEKDGVCQACINNEAKKDINFAERQEWLTRYIQARKGKDYDCVIAVSGGKDSHAITRRLVENHGVKKALFVTVTDEFTPSGAGKHNINNLVTRYNFDHIIFRCEPQTFKAETLKDFENELHPLKWIEAKIYSVPVMIAKQLGIRLVFFGENSAFEYGTSEELEIFHPGTDNDTEIIFMGAIWPYSIKDSLQQARETGFIDLDQSGDWKRIGNIEPYTQIDSKGYLVQLWTKYVKFGFQRVADVACRMVREGTLSKEEAEELIKAHDHKLDPTSKFDFCQSIGITSEYFDSVVDKHANRDIVEKIDGQWRVKE